MLKFSKGNAKLAKDTIIFNLPAGRTCPGAKICKSMATIAADGTRRIKDSKNTQFRCFAASSEVQYSAVYEARQHNFKSINLALKKGKAGELLNAGIQNHRTKNTKKVRIHGSGDYFSKQYLLAWIEAARMNPDLVFYGYTKSLDLFIGLELPNNFYITASYGGKHDHLIDQGHFKRYSKVFTNELEAEKAGLEVDHDDSHCLGAKPFALLVHGTQPAGSVWSKAISERRKNKGFSGYSKIAAKNI